MIGSSAGFPTIDFSPYGAHRLGLRSCPGLCWSTLAVNCHLICVPRPVWWGLWPGHCGCKHSADPARLAGAVQLIEYWRHHHFQPGCRYTHHSAIRHSLVIWTASFFDINQRHPYVLCLHLCLPDIHHGVNKVRNCRNTCIPWCHHHHWPGLMLWT